MFFEAVNHSGAPTPALPRSGGARASQITSPRRSLPRVAGKGKGGGRNDRRAGVCLKLSIRYRSPECQICRSAKAGTQCETPSMRDKAHVCE